MKFRIKTQLVAALCASTLVVNAFAAAENYEFDPTHTYPSFEISHLGFSTMRGLFTETTGTLTLDVAAKTGTVEATIKADSVFTGHEKRDEHLKGKDFFNVSDFPTITLKANKFKFDGQKVVKAEGALTMLGVTKPVNLTVKSTKCAVRAVDNKFICGADVSTVIKRSDWGMKYATPFVGDEVTIKVEVEAMRLDDKK